MPVLDLAVRPGQLEGARRGGRLAELVGQGQGLVAGLGEGGGQRHHRGAARLDAEPAAEAEDRVEHRADGPREDGAGLERGRVGRRAAAAEEPRAVGLVLRLADRLAPRGRAVHRRDVHRPQRLLGGRSHPPPAEDRLRAGEPLRLQEELDERRMAEVGTARGQHDLGVAGQLQLARRRDRD